MPSLTTTRPSSPPRSSLRARAGRVALVLLAAPALLAADCVGGGDAGWVQFNAQDETLTIPVGPDVSTDPASLTLTSTTGTVDVGEAVVTPGGGPVGTQHDVVITVLDEFEDTVGRVTVVTSGDRGTQRHFLVQDSADPGRWQVSVTSLGAEGETREDVFTVNLWRPAEEGEDADTDADSEGE